jgi:hypothetical protein
MGGEKAVRLPEIRYLQPDVWHWFAEFDPYPNHKPHEIVERRVIGNEFFIEGEHISDHPLEMGANLVVDDLKYTIVLLNQCHRSLQNQPRMVESKPATLKCFIHIRFLDSSKRFFSFFICCGRTTKFIGIRVNE